ncbi:MAG: hypothetical protein WCE62_17505 [Polyangiales bacterium]
MRAKLGENPGSGKQQNRRRLLPIVDRNVPASIGPLLDEARAGLGGLIESSIDKELLCFAFRQTAALD